MVSELSGLPAKLIEVAEALETRATDVARNARKAAGAWKPWIVSLGVV